MQTVTFNNSPDVACRIVDHTQHINRQPALVRAPLMTGEDY